SADRGPCPAPRTLPPPTSSLPDSVLPLPCVASLTPFAQRARAQERAARCKRAQTAPTARRLAPYMDSLASALHERGYTRDTARMVLVRASSFSRYLERIGIERTRKIDEDLVRRFLRGLASKGRYASSPRE